MRNLTAWLEFLTRASLEQGSAFVGIFKALFCFCGSAEIHRSRERDIEIVYQVNRMACCPARLVLKIHFPPEKKAQQRVEHFAISSFSIVCYVFRFSRFIDIIMGNFRQHEKIYFTSCSSWSNFEWEEGKVYRGKLFFIDIVWHLLHLGGISMSVSVVWKRWGKEDDLSKIDRGSSRYYVVWRH